MITDKERVVERLLRVCECESEHEGCGKPSPNGGWNCSRDPGHKGRHFACGELTHKFDEWD